jgi:hypothetical protein
MRAMIDIVWYAEASLCSDEHVFCAGSLAQCVRKWTRLTEAQRATTHINMGGRTGLRAIVGCEEIAQLARNPELARA